MMRMKYFTISLILFVIIITPVVLGQTSESKIYLLDLNYNKGNLSLIDVRIKIGFPPERIDQPTFTWKAELLSFNNDLLYNLTFAIPNVFLQVPPLEGQPTGEPITLENVNFTLILPYYRNGKVIDIFNKNNQLALSVDVSKYATCNMNAICDTNENYQICPEDCKKESSNFIIYSILGIALITLIVILYSRSKRRK